jgi:hypothetical protein
VAPGTGISLCLRWVVAIFLVGAAVLHFAYSPAHFDQYWLYGTFFVVVAWLQVGGALAIILRPSRLVLVGIAMVNAAVIAVWVLSRTSGVWIGPDATVKEAVGYPDVLSTSLEVGAVVGCLLLLAWAPSLARRLHTCWLVPVVAGIAAMLVAGSAAYAMTPSFAAAHNHAAGGHVHATVGLTGTTPCEKAGPPASEGQVLDSSGHFHRGPTAQLPLDETTRIQLEAEQVEARAVAVKYPTVADAERAGYRQSTVYVPCIGAHYTNVALAAHFDVSAPSELLYDGIRPTSRIVGLSFLVFHLGGAPDGFAGPNDHWHQHTFNGGLCIGHNGLVIGAESTSAAECAARGGTKAALNNIWMLHDWVVPGFECSWGVFAPECPELGGRTGTSAWQN